MRVVLDTNVFVSAFVFGGLPGKILDLYTDEAFVLYLSDEIVAELRRVLTESFDWSQEDIDAVLEPILSRVEVVIPTPGILGSRDLNDNHILACAHASKADAIVTGDNDLLVLKEFEGVPIITPRGFVEVLSVS
jgi:putative PIN family toxin of toxin-antitoxin system